MDDKTIHDKIMEVCKYLEEHPQSFEESITEKLQTLSSFFYWLSIWLNKVEQHFIPKSDSEEDRSDSDVS